MKKGLLSILLIIIFIGSALYIIIKNKQMSYTDNNTLSTKVSKNKGESKYLSMFNEIVSIMHTDYSGFKDKSGWDNPEKYRNQILRLEDSNSMTDKLFKDIVDDYLLDFKDSHIFLNFNNPTEYKISGFTTRRYEDKLYITDITQEYRLQKGMAILELDGISINELSYKYKRELKTEDTDRQEWSSIIRNSKSAKVQDREGNIFNFDLKLYNANSVNITPCKISLINEETAVITLDTFYYTDYINQTLEDNKDILDNCRNLIIDVRKNDGGSDSSFQKLLEYIFKGEVDINTFSINYDIEYNLTDRNYELLVDSFKNESQILTNNKGKGFVTLYPKANKEPIKFLGKDKPEKVIILSDKYCGSSGDSFVEIAKESDKVIVVGRPTAGVTDYSNLVSYSLNDTFTFKYPTTRSKRIDVGMELEGKGVQVDIHIPWTPEHIDTDIDMIEAKKILNLDELK